MYCGADGRGTVTDCYGINDLENSKTGKLSSSEFLDWKTLFV